MGLLNAAWVQGGQCACTYLSPQNTVKYQPSSVDFLKVYNALGKVKKFGPPDPFFHSLLKKVWAHCAPCTNSVKPNPHKPGGLESRMNNSSSILDNSNTDVTWQKTDHLLLKTYQYKRNSFHFRLYGNRFDREMQMITILLIGS